MVRRGRARKERRTVAQWDLADHQVRRDRAQSARWLLEHQPFLSVEPYTDDWPGPDGADFVVGLHEVAGHAFPDLLEATVLMLLDRPDIVEALNEDAEVIHLWGQIAEPQDLEDDLRHWWFDRLGQCSDEEAPT